MWLKVNELYINLDKVTSIHVNDRWEEITFFFGEREDDGYIKIRKKDIGEKRFKEAIEEIRGGIVFKYKLIEI